MCSLLDKSDCSAGDFIDGTNHLFQSVVTIGLSTNSEPHCFHRVQQPFDPCGRSFDRFTIDQLLLTTEYMWTIFTSKLSGI